MGNLVQAEAKGLLHTSLLTATDTYTAPTGPMNLALIVTGGTASTETTAGTEASGSGYARQTISFGATTWDSTNKAAQTANTNAISFTNMPAGTIHQIEIWDSTPTTPVRRWWGNLTTDKTLGAGDTISFAVGAIAIELG